MRRSLEYFQIEHSNVDWSTGQWNSPTAFSFTGDSFVSRVTGSVDEGKVNISCALLMMGATTPETSPKLEC